VSNCSVQCVHFLGSGAKIYEIAAANWTKKEHKLLVNILLHMVQIVARPSHIRWHGIQAALIYYYCDYYHYLKLIEAFLISQYYYYYFQMN
jgi:hypothetical protein